MSEIPLCENCRKAQASKSGHFGQCYCHMLRMIQSAPPPASLGDEEKPNLYTLRQGVPSEMLSKIQAWARAESCEWPHGTYSPNDFPAFFEKGALWGLRTSQASLSEALKRGEEDREKLRAALESISAAYPEKPDGYTQFAGARAREALGDGDRK